MSSERLGLQLGLLFFLLIAILFVLGSGITLDLGTARRLGPGAFPMIVGVIMIALVVVELLRNHAAPAEWRSPDWRSLFAVSAGVAAFAFFTPLVGVLPAVAISVLATSSANKGVRWTVRGAMAVCIAIGVWVIFVEALQMPFELIRGL
ncbi:MAG: tripartite tricarboxylate transporter TctB family protein [Rhodobacteraceae bacterium]|nr:tripartite tricarboxylate transporter TctB family protein [Paracoccaceae bacterium]